MLPVVGECDDSGLNDGRGRHVTERDVLSALDGASDGKVAEGSVGAGTGMVAYGFKGGIGTASRTLDSGVGGYTVGALVNANQGVRPDLIIDGVHVGRDLRRGRPRRPRHRALDRHRGRDRRSARP
jgi:D-aminopeptidase